MFFTCLDEGFSDEECDEQWFNCIGEEYEEYGESECEEEADVEEAEEGEEEDEESEITVE